MNPMVIVAALAVAGFSWMLISILRAGEFKLGNGSYGRTTGHVRRDTDPVRFWMFVALQAGLILYLASLGVAIWMTPAP